MQLTGDMLIGGTAVRGVGAAIRAVNPSSGQDLDPPFPGRTTGDVQRACALAWACFDAFRKPPWRGAHACWRPSPSSSSAWATT